MPFARMSDGQVLPATNINELQIGIEALDKTKPRFHVRDYGAIPDGTTNNLTAIQNAINAMLSSYQGGYVDISGGNYAINGTLTMTAPNGTDLYGVGIVGDGRGSKLTQLADNTAIITFVGSNIHSLYFNGFQPTWSTAASNTKTNRSVFRSASSGNFYNSYIGHMTGSNGHYFIDMPTTLNVWGVRFENIMWSASTGGFSKLLGAAGQPNNGFFQIYLGAQTMDGPIFHHNAMNAVLDNIEINQASLGPILFQDNAGGNYVVGMFGCEGGTWSTANRHLFVVDDSSFIAQHIFVTGSVTQVTNIFRSAGRGFVDVKFLIMQLAPSGSGHVFVSNIGGSNTTNPNLQRGEVFVDKIRSMTGIVPWVRTGNKIALTDVGNTGSADATYVREWNDPSRIAFLADADRTLDAGDAPVQVVTGALAATRTITLPHGELLHSARTFTFVKTATTTGALNIVKSGGAAVTSIAAVTKARVTVVWNRSLANGPAYDSWTVIDYVTLP